VRGLQVLDEAEFLRFFHRLLQRPDLNDLFEKVSHKYKGEQDQLLICLKGQSGQITWPENGMGYHWIGLSYDGLSLS
jgi:hypothetical protein